MPKYKIQSGDMLCEMETTHPASASALAILAINGYANKTLGRIIEVSGGQYTRSNVTYVSTLQILRDMGEYPPEDQDETRTKEAN